MPRISKTLLFCMTFLASPLLAQEPLFLTELEQLDVDTALVFPSSAIDYYPIWSPDSKQIAVNETGEWTYIDLDSVHLGPAKWLDAKIGVINQDPVYGPLASEDQAIFENATTQGTRLVTTPEGDIIELREHGISTVFSITPKGQDRVVYWQTGMDACYNLSLSPDGLFVAFLCAQNGLFIRKL